MNIIKHSRRTPGNSNLLGTITGRGWLKRAAIIISVCFFTALTSAQPARQTAPPNVFASFKSSLDQLRQRFSDKSEDDLSRQIAALLLHIGNNVDFLQQVIALKKPVPGPYMESLILDAELMNQIARQKAGTVAEIQEVRDRLREVDSDLTLKVTTPRGSTDAKDVTRVVEVFVRAGNENASDYEVWYVLKGWAGDQSKFKIFDRPTNPSKTTSMKLAPGNYFIWLRKGNLSTPRQPTEVGINGESKKDIVVNLP